MDSIALSKREKVYIQTVLNNKDELSKDTKISNYDLNYRLKKKFLQMHEDYWSLVLFFKSYNENFQKRTTEQTTDTLLKAKSQIVPQGTLVNAKCVFCKGSNKKMLEVNICSDCSAGFGF